MKNKIIITVFIIFVICLFIVSVWKIVYCINKASVGICSVEGIKMRPDYKIANYLINEK